MKTPTTKHHVSSVAKLLCHTHTRPYICFSATIYYVSDVAKSVKATGRAGARRQRLGLFQSLTCGLMVAQFG